MCSKRTFPKLHASAFVKYNRDYLNVNRSKKQCCQEDNSILNYNLQYNDPYANLQHTEDNTWALEENHPIFRIHLIVLPILRNLMHHELLTCRLINLNFENFAAEIIRKSKLYLTFKYNQETKVYLLTTQVQDMLVSSNQGNHRMSKTLMPLADLTHILKESFNFPIKNFRFLRGSLSDTTLQEFLEVYGTEIKEICIDVLVTPPEYLTTSESIPYPSIAMLRSLFANQLPHVELLCLQYFPQGWTTAKNKLFSLESPKIVLPNLKHLIFPDCRNRQVFEDIFNAAVNLESLNTKYFCLDVVKQNKAHILTLIHYIPSHLNCELYKSLLHPLKPHLKSISVYLYPLHHFQILKEVAASQLLGILKANASTLSHFELHSPLQLLYDTRCFKIPQLPKVTCLKILANPTKSIRPIPQIKTMISSFPLGFNFKISFPNLKTVIFELWDVSIENGWEEIFENLINSEEVSSVASLIFKEAEFFIPNLLFICSDVFPNVTNVEINSKYITDAPMNGLYHFRHLKTLQCRINIGELEGTDARHDTIFTGISHPTCKSLEYSSVVLGSPVLKSLRIFDSALRLKELETLAITVFDETTRNILYYPTIFTHVTGIYAFNMMPKVYTTLDLRAKTEHNLMQIMAAMRPILPFVKSYRIFCDD